MTLGTAYFPFDDGVGWSEEGDTGRQFFNGAVDLWNIQPDDLVWSAIHRSDLNALSTQAWELSARFYSQSDQWQHSLVVSFAPGDVYVFRIAGFGDASCGPANSLRTFKSGDQFANKWLLHANDHYSETITQCGITNLEDKWNWIKIVYDGAGTLKHYIVLNQLTLPLESDWVHIPALDRSFTLTVDAIGAQMTVSNFTGTSHTFCDDMVFKTGVGSAFEGFDPSIKLSDYFLRAAINTGGSGLVVSDNPFYEVAASVLQAQQKNALEYFNIYGILMFKGEVGPVVLGTHGASFELEEMTRKLEYTPVDESPVIYSLIIRQVNNASRILIDKDGDFINKGVTTSHLVSFQKENKKVFETRPDFNTYSVKEDDYITTHVVNGLDNNKDEELYYRDVWESDDTGKSLIIWGSAGSPGLNPITIHFPMNIYEKYNNLDKLKSIVIKTEIGGPTNKFGGWADDKFSNEDTKMYWVLYNYNTAAFETCKKYLKGDFKGEVKLSTEASKYFFEGRLIQTDMIEELKAAYTDWDNAITYNPDDRAISAETLYTCILQTTGNEPPNATYWQRTIYDFIDYESLAGTPDDFSKLNIIFVIRTVAAVGVGVGFQMWSLSAEATFDEDNEPEYSSAEITAVTATSITTSQTSGLNLPYEDGFGINDLIHVVKSAVDYLQDAYDNNADLVSNLGPLTLDITGGAAVGITDNHKYKSFYVLMQHINELTNSTMWPNYNVIASDMQMKSADKIVSCGVVLTKADIVGWDQEKWSITYDSTKQRDQIIIVGDNVVYSDTLAADESPFDLGPETEIIEDSSIQTLLQAQKLAAALAPRLKHSEILATLTINYSFPIQSYLPIIQGKSIALQLPTSTDTSICDFSSGGDGELFIIDIQINKNAETGDQEHITLTLQRRWVT